MHLSTDLSSAFFALASANRNAAALLGPGRQFGRDQYDERMKSTLQVEIEKRELALREDGVDEETEQEGKDAQSGTETETEIGEEEKSRSKQDPIDSKPRTRTQTQTQSPLIPPSFPSLSHLHFAITPTSPTASSFGPTKTKTKPPNPLHQFHPLPPPSLRQTQSLFTKSVTSIVPSLLTTISQMKTVETEIWRVRREMGIVGQYQSGSEVETESEAKERGEEEREEEDGGEPSTEKEREHGVMKTTRAKQQSSSKSSVHNLVSRSRPSEPRSRVLKVD